MNEKFIEKKLIKEVKKRHGICPKFISPGLDGVPDRIVLLEDARIAFIETKAPGKKLRPLQQRRKREFERLGFKVYVINKIEQIGGVLDEISST